MLAVFVDFDGTITDIDTFDALVRAYAGEAVWSRLDADLKAGRVTLRDTLAAQAALVQLTRPEALAFIRSKAHVDPEFKPFVVAVRAHGGTVRVLSSGITSVIADALERADVDVEILANEADFSPSGWTIAFLDDSANGHDKAAHVRAARAAGIPTIYIGDGISDYEAASLADRVFAKRGRALEVYCRERGLPFVPFSSFAEIVANVFGSTSPSSSPLD
jgi:2,3-diketo-5-methylthio-1-phosphopentane phosphatase